MAYALTQLHAIVNKSFVTGRALPRGHAKTINYARETVGWVSEALPIVSRDSARAYRSKQAARAKPNARPQIQKFLFLFFQKRKRFLTMPAYPKPPEHRSSRYPATEYIPVPAP